ncbi:MAG: NADH-quinone oxidoreductase subunit A [Candidatus Bathyarchaeia archaeon]
MAFALIVGATSVIYLLGRRAAPKPVQSENRQSAYACGEKATFHGLKVNVSLYKFLIYFVIFDSAVLLIAFASLSAQGTNIPLLILYMFMILVSGLILLEGGKD